jgi:hydroxylamine reductase (hybrid-cluster protein)
MDTILLLCILLLIYCIFYSDIVYAKSNKDGKLYIIRRGHEKSEEFLTNSANTLAEINARVERLIDYLTTHYQNDQSKNYFIQKLRENYHYSILSEAEVDPRYTTYTVDKEDMHICLRTRDNNEIIYDINTLMYVLLHELSHLCNYNRDGTAILGHGEEFIMIFRFLVREAVNIGIYNYVDYTKTPQSYCGIVISSQILN